MELRLAGLVVAGMRIMVLEVWLLGLWKVEMRDMRSERAVV